LSFEKKLQGDKIASPPAGIGLRIPVFKFLKCKNYDDLIEY